MIKKRFFMINLQNKNSFQNLLFPEDLGFLNPRSHLKWSPNVKKYKNINKHCSSSHVSWIFLQVLSIKYVNLFPYVISDYKEFISL